SRVAEEKRRRRVYDALMQACFRRGRYLPSATAIQAAIDNILAFVQNETIADRQHMFDRHKAKRACLSVLEDNIDDAGSALHDVADKQISVKDKASARPHAARQRHGRKKSPARGMSILGQLHRRGARLSKTEMNELRRGFSDVRSRPR